MLLMPERPDCVDFDQNVLQPGLGLVADAFVTAPPHIQVGRTQGRMRTPLDLAPEPMLAPQIRIEIHRPGEGGIDIVRQRDNARLVNINMDALLATQTDLIERMVACANPGDQFMNLETAINFQSGSHFKGG